MAFFIRTLFNFNLFIYFLICIKYFYGNSILLTKNRAYKTYWNFFCRIYRIYVLRHVNCIVSRRSEIFLRSIHVLKKENFNKSISDFDYPIRFRNSPINKFSSKILSFKFDVSTRNSSVLNLLNGIYHIFGSTFSGVYFLSLN